MNVYDQIAAEAARVGWPEAFQTDLTFHDRRALEGGDAPRTFVWVLRREGTHILRPEDGGSPNAFVCALRRIHPELIFYTCRDGVLRRATLEEALDLLRPAAYDQARDDL